MAKSTKDDEQDAEKEIEEEESSTDGEEEEEASTEKAAEEKPAARSAAERRAARKRERAAAREVEQDHGHDHDHAHDDDEEEGDGEDPYWWTPHAVMSALVLIGVLGFFGIFNKVLGGIAAKPIGGEANKPVAAKEATPPPTPAKPPTPAQGEQQQPREMFGAKHLLVMYKGGRRAPPNVERTKEEAKVRATEALKKAKDGKSKFEDLVKEYSDEPNAGARGGDLGKFPKGAMVPEFQAALEKIKVNEVSDVVETPFGYHVILRTQ